MSRDILPSKKKIQTFIFGSLLILILNLISDSIQLNEKANRSLTNLLNIPSNFLSQVLRDYQEFENERIAKLENDILDLQNTIYEKDLEIQSLENSKSYNPVVRSNKDESNSSIISFDQLNFNCCKKHRVYVSNPNNIVGDVLSVSQGDFVIGKTRTISDEVEVRLLSDPEEYISIKNTKNFFCIANGNGEPMTIICKNESKAVDYEIGDTFFTTGFDGIHPEGLIVGRLKKITTEDDFFNETLEIELFFNPFKSMNKRVILHD